MAGSKGGLVDASVSGCIRAILIAYAAYSAYAIRLFAVQEYGRIIHEFDPWFNFRATQYLAETFPAIPGISPSLLLSNTLCAP